jgi:hypothetical protein
MSIQDSLIFPGRTPLSCAQGCAVSDVYRQLAHDPKTRPVQAPMIATCSASERHSTNRNAVMHRMAGRHGCTACCVGRTSFLQVPPELISCPQVSGFRAGWRKNDFANLCTSWSCASCCTLAMSAVGQAMDNGLIHVGNSLTTLLKLGIPELRGILGPPTLWLRTAHRWTARAHARLLQYI